MNAEQGDATLPIMTPQELRVRKAFVGLKPEFIKALRALQPWMEAHVHEVIKEFYAHLLRFDEPQRLLADPQVLARAKAAQTDYLRNLTAGVFDTAYVASRLAIGRTHERVGVSPQWYLGAYSIFARILFPQMLLHYRDQPEVGIEAVKALMAAMHLDMQLAIDAYIASYHQQIEAAYRALQHHATNLENEVAARTSELAARARQLETLYRISAAASRELNLDKVLASTLPPIVEVVGAVGAEAYLVDEEGCLSWAASYGLAEDFVEVSRSLRFQVGEGIPGRAFAIQAPVFVQDLSREARFLRREAALACGYRALLCAPLLAQRRALGILQLYSRDERGCPPEALLLVQTIAEQLAVAIANARLHHTLKTSEAEYRSLVENTPRVIFRLDLHGRCTFVNQAVQAMLGWPPQAVLSASRLRDLLGHPDDWPASALTRVLEGEVRQGVECRLHHRNGAWRWCELTLYPWRRGDEQIFGVEGIVEDITEQKRLAQEMARSERLALAGQLASGLAHEIGTPLNGFCRKFRFLRQNLKTGCQKFNDLQTSKFPKK